MDNNRSNSSGSEDLIAKPTRFILRYPGSCITFNLLQARRMKKDGKTISEKWDNEDDDNFLILRLIESNGSPWLVVHHGIYEVIKSPLFVPVQKCSDNCKSISILLRDHANRGSLKCIRREFCFKFNSLTEADSFLFSHNSFVTNKQKQQEKDCKTRSVEMTSGSERSSRRRKESRVYQKRYRDQTSSSSSEGEEDMEERKISSLPSEIQTRKKRRLDHEGRAIGRRATKKVKALSAIGDNKLAYEAVVSNFWVGDAANAQDDNFENTPTPWGSEDE